MVFKIELDDFENFDELLHRLTDKFVFLYLDFTLYVALRSYSKIDAKAELSSILKENKSYTLTEIDETNLKHEAPVIMEWCRDNLLRLDKQRFELNEQKELHKLWEDLNTMETKLNEQMKNRKEAQSLG